MYYTGHTKVLLSVLNDQIIIMFILDSIVEDQTGKWRERKSGQAAKDLRSETNLGHCIQPCGIWSSCQVVS